MGTVTYVERCRQAEVPGEDSSCQSGWGCITRHGRMLRGLLPSTWTSGPSFSARSNVGERACQGPPETIFVMRAVEGEL